MFKDIYGKEIKVGQKICCMPRGYKGIMMKGEILGFNAKSLRVSYVHPKWGSGASWAKSEDICIVGEPENGT